MKKPMMSDVISNIRRVSAQQTKETIQMLESMFDSALSAGGAHGRAAELAAEIAELDIEHSEHWKQVAVACNTIAQHRTGMWRC